MSGDPERDGSKARPTAPAGVLGDASTRTGKRPESAPLETTNRAPKSAFAHTIAMPTAAPAPAAEPEKLSMPRSTSDAAEPLRDPSERPAPTPYMRERAQGQWGGTLQMPEVKPPGARSEERMIAAKPSMRADGGAVEVHGAAKIGTPEPTVHTATAAIAPSGNRPASNRSSGLPAAPPPSGAPPAMPSLAAAAKSPMPPPPKRDDPSVPRLSLGVEKIPSGGPAMKPDITAMSQPIQLSLSASDHVETSLRPESHVPQRSMLPWIVIALVLIGGGVVFAMTRGGDEPAPVAQDRVEAVPAVEPSAAAPTEAPQAAVPTVPVAPVVPSAPPPVVKPEAPVTAPVEQAKAQPKEEKVEAPAKPSTKRKVRRSKKPARADGPVLKVSPQGEGDLEEALRAAERMAEPEEEDLAPPEPPSAEPPSPD